MRKPAFFAALGFALIGASASAEEDAQAAYAIESFKKFVAAAKAKDVRGISQFISTYDWPALVKSGKQDELIEKMTSAAGKEGAKFTYKEVEGSKLTLNGELLIQPDGVRVPIVRSGDLWQLDVNKLVGEVEVSPDEKKAYQAVGGVLLVLSSYRESAGAYPSTEQGLQALVEKPTTKPIPARWFRMRREVPKDPWGNDFVYSSTEDGITVRCLGPDGKESDDDVVNPF